MQTLASTAGDSVIVPRNLHTAGAAALSTLEVHGTTDQGVAIRYVFHGVFMYDGGFNRIEYFADDQWTAALARLDELGALNPPIPARRTRSMPRSTPSSRSVRNSAVGPRSPSGSPRT